MVRVIFWFLCVSLGCRTAPLVLLLSVWVMRRARQLVNFDKHKHTHTHWLYQRRRKEKPHGGMCLVAITDPWLFSVKEIRRKARLNRLNLNYFWPCRAFPENFPVLVCFIKVSYWYLQFTQLLTYLLILDLSRTKHFSSSFCSAAQTEQGFLILQPLSCSVLSFKLDSPEGTVLLCAQ